MLWRAVTSPWGWVNPLATPQLCFPGWGQVDYLHTAHAGPRQQLQSSKHHTVSSHKRLWMKLGTDKQVAGKSVCMTWQIWKCKSYSAVHRGMGHLVIPPETNDWKTQDGFVKEIITSQIHLGPWKSQWGQGCQLSSLYIIFRFPRSFW